MNLALLKIAGEGGGRRVKNFRVSEARIRDQPSLRAEFAKIYRRPSERAARQFSGVPFFWFLFLGTQEKNRGAGRSPGQ